LPPIFSEYVGFSAQGEHHPVEASRRNEIKRRYGATINLKEKVVSPEDLYNSSMVRTIFSNY
jgi:hypothetical protein